MTMTGVVIAGFSSLLTGLNFIVTVHWLRAPGLNWFRLPIFVWTMYATSFIFLLAVPVLAMALILVIIERLWQIGIFDPALGGDPLLFQHLFWFYSHPAVYIMILPGMGVVSEVIPCFARKQLYGYKFVAYSSFGIACLGFFVWAHHMFVAGISLYAALIFSSLSFLVAVPSAIKVFNWTATLYKGSITLRGAHAVRAGVCRAVHVRRHGRPVPGHARHGHARPRHLLRRRPLPFHHGRRDGDGLHGRSALLVAKNHRPHVFSDWWSRLTAMIIFIGFFLTFLPQFVAGYNGMPRRYHMYAPEYQVWNVMSTAGASILGVGYVLPLFYLIASLWSGKPAGRNPWHATGLEWQTASPPPTENFEQSPVVVRPPYQYHLEKAQNEP